jgi:uncharacterized cupin superfamily protein
MNKINIREIEEIERKSPHGKYHLFRRHLSLALSGKPDAGTWGGGHPFDLEMVRVPPGAKNFPLHQHAAQWELYLIVSGRGEVTNGTETRALEAGDTMMFAPGSPHQLANSGSEDFIYYVIADQPPADVSFYPETGSWGIKPQRKHFIMNEEPYFRAGD